MVKIRTTRPIYNEYSHNWDGMYQVRIWTDRWQLSIAPRWLHRGKHEDALIVMRYWGPFYLYRLKKAHPWPVRAPWSKH